MQNYSYLFIKQGNIVAHAVGEGTEHYEFDEVPSNVLLDFVSKAEEITAIFTLSG